VSFNGVDYDCEIVDSAGQVSLGLGFVLFCSSLVGFAGRVIRQGWKSEGDCVTGVAARLFRIPRALYASYLPYA
jgi:hypothetical protein